MGKTWMAMVAMAALAAGCLQAPVPPRAGELLPPSTDRFVEAHDGCTGYLLAALVDPLRTDAHLPPGFHLRDPRDFLRGVGTGQALLLVSATVCAPTRDAPAWRNAVASLFVQPPSVPGERPPADYDLYEVEHYSPEPQVQRRLQAWGWPVANVSLEDESVPEARTHVFAFAADAGPVPFPSAGDNPPLFRFGGPTPLPPDAIPFNPIVLRIWRDTPLGLAHLDHSWPSPLGLGSGFCLFRPNSTLARLAGGDVCNVPPASGDPDALRMWQPQPTLVATFSTGFRATGALLRGVHAR